LLYDYHFKLYVKFICAWGKYSDFQDRRWSQQYRNLQKRKQICCFCNEHLAPAGLFFLQCQRNPSRFRYWHYMGQKWHHCYKLSCSQKCLKNQHYIIQSHNSPGQSRWTGTGKRHSTFKNWYRCWADPSSDWRFQHTWSRAEGISYWKPVRSWYDINRWCYQRSWQRNWYIF